jgi:hypothetical protein
VPTIIERLHQLGVGRRTLGVELEGWAETYGEDLVRLVECEATRGSITQRGRGSWQVAFRTGGGDRVRETVRGTRTDAERRLTELLREYDMTGSSRTGRPPSPCSPSSGSSMSPTESSRSHSSATASC